jgi:hypothetical protein
MLDLIEHCLKLSDCSFIRLFSKDTFELTPDDCTAKFLLLRVANTLENSVLKLLFPVLDEVKVAAVMNSIKIVFDDFWVG